MSNEGVMVIILSSHYTVLVHRCTNLHFWRLTNTTIQKSEYISSFYTRLHLLVETRDQRTRVNRILGNHTTGTGEKEILGHS